MRITTVVLLVLFLIIGCESPQDLSSEQSLYKGQFIRNEPAPFLLNGNNLSKDTEGILILDEEVPDGIVYGLKNDTEVYAAEGGEVLPKKSWIDNVGSDPVEVSLTSGLTITFETLTSVTIIDAQNMIYIDENGTTVVFSGSGVITTTEISTGSNGFATLICTGAFSIGEEGGEIA
ncbi:MAG: hypothetical protein HQ506_12505 [Candidatus Marinimicrobia bacterium]|nr:hypothetical protein [Candidatus Neomarinimicrobiota bacterium]